jgi:hypothetical protein
MAMAVVTGEELRPSAEVIAKRLDEGAVLVHIPSNRIFELNETGSRVWELLGQGLDVSQIASLLVNEFEVEETRAGGEVKAILGKLRDQGLLA